MKPTIQLCKFQLWSPKLSAAGGISRLAVVPCYAKKSPSLRAIVASDGNANHWIVPAKHIAAFLLQHADTHLVFDAVGIDFWTIHRLLREHDKSDARLWKRRLETGRLSSVPLFDQLLYLAIAEGDEAETLPRRSLDAIAEDARSEPAAIQINLNHHLDSVSHECLKRSAEKVLLLLQTYQHIRHRAKRIAEGEGRDVRADAIQRFGLLTEHLQAAAEVALTRLSRRGVRVNRAGLRDLQEQLQQEQLRIADRLAKLVPGLLVESWGRFEFTDTGKIRRRDTVLDDFLNCAFQKALCKDPTTIRPTTEKGNISRKPQDWQPFARDNPALRHWQELERVQNAFQFLPKLDHSCLHPNHTTLLRTGRASFANPPLQSLPRDGGVRELIVPRHDHAFLVVDCQCFELAALAAICRHRYGKSRLAEILEGGQDPHAWTAARLTAMTDAEFRSLRKEEKRRYETLRQRAKAINFGVPGGMSAATLAAHSSTEFGITMTHTEAARFRESLLNVIYPELHLYLADCADQAITLTGRVRAGVSFTQRCNTVFQGLAADAAKHALVQLVASGRRVVLFVHDEFVLEIPCQYEKVDRETVVAIVKQIEAVTSEVIGLPIRCEYSVADCWSKRAVRKKEVGDTLSVWSPSKPVW